jgi:hypothetical protein
VASSLISGELVRRTIARKDKFNAEGQSGMEKEKELAIMAPGTAVPYMIAAWCGGRLQLSPAAESIPCLDHGCPGNQAVVQPAAGNSSSTKRCRSPRGAPTNGIAMITTASKNRTQKMGWCTMERAIGHQAIPAESKTADSTVSQSGHGPIDETVALHLGVLP